MSESSLLTEEGRAGIKVDDVLVGTHNKDILKVKVGATDEGEFVYHELDDEGNTVRTHKSLSKAATHFAGTSQNGWRFFRPEAEHEALVAEKEAKRAAKPEKPKRERKEGSTPRKPTMKLVCIHCGGSMSIAEGRARAAQEASTGVRAANANSEGDAGTDANGSAEWSSFSSGSDGSDGSEAEKPNGLQAMTRAQRKAAAQQMAQAEMKARDEATSEAEEMETVNV